MVSENFHQRSHPVEVTELGHCVIKVEGRKVALRASKAIFLPLKERITSGSHQWKKERERGERKRERQKGAVCVVPLPLLWLDRGWKLEMK